MVSGLAVVPESSLDYPMAQLLGPGEIEVPPGARFGLVAQLLQGLGLELPGRLIVRVGKDHVVHDLGHPAIVALGRKIFGPS